MSPRLLAVGLGLLLLGVACQEPFGTDRHDLVGDRVVAIAVDPPGGAPGTEVTARVALIVDGHPWADTAPTLEWHWLASTDPRTLSAVDPADPADATGPTPTLTMPERPDPAALGLVASFPSGDVDRAFVELPLHTPDPTPALQGLTFDPPGPWTPDDHVTITAQVADETNPPMARWMTVGGRGTFLEQARTVTGWDAATIVRDKGEVVSDTPIDPGPVTFVVLAVDEAGGNDFRAEEGFVGDVSTGLWTTSGRWLGADRAPDTSGLWTGTLVADDAAPTGLSLTDLVDVPDATPIVDAPPCGPAAPFDPTWLLQGRCLRSDVVGRTVTVEVR